MKLAKFTLLLALPAVTLFSCKRELDPPPAKEHVKDAYRVLAIGKVPGDTSTSSTMWARTETVGLVVAEDDKLRAELIGYQNINGQGVYTWCLQLP